MKAHRIKPFLVKLRDADSSISMKVVSGGLLFGKSEKTGKGYCINLDKCTIHPSNSPYCDGHRYDVQREAIDAKVVEEIKSEIQTLLNIDFRSANEEQRLDTLWRAWKTGEWKEIAKERYAKELPKPIPQAPPSLSDLVIDLALGKTTIKDVYPKVNARFQVPKFSCKPDQQGTGWYVTDVDGHKKNVEWLLDLVLAAPERVDT